MLDTVLDRPRTRAAAARASAAALLAVALAAGATACGSDDDGGGGGSGAPAQADSQTTDRDTGAGAGAGAETGEPTTPASDKQQVRQLLDDLQADYIAGRGDDYCSGLTAAGRKQIADVARSYGHGNSCQDFVVVTSKLTRDAKVKQRPTVVLSVRVDGDRATARVSDGGRPSQPMTFVKIDGDWKLPDPGLRAALSGDTKPPPPKRQTP